MQVGKDSPNRAEDFIVAPGEDREAVCVLFVKGSVVYSTRLDLRSGCLNTCVWVVCAAFYESAD